MKHVLLIIEISLIAAVASAQNAIDYFKGINEGKIYAIENDYDSAINSYEQVFRNSDFVFARDCFNAIELSILGKDTVKIRYFIERAILQGIRISDIEKSYELTDYIGLDILNAIKANEDSLVNIYSSRINWKIREEINQMFSEDQKIREEYYTANIFQRNKNIKKETIFII